VSGRQRDDQMAMKRRDRAPRHDQSAIRRAREGRDGALDFGRVAHVERADLHPQRRRHGLDGGAKKFQVREKIPLSALAFGCSHALVAEGFTEPSASQ
jgi:hypothetical protein